MSICNTAHFAISLPCRHLAALARPARTDPAEKGRTGATPLFCRCIGKRGGGVCNRVCNNPPPLFQGSLPSDLSLREGSGHGTQAGADAPEASPMKMRYPILISGGLCCSAWGFIYRPFPMPGDDPVLDLVLYHTPTSTAGSSAGTTPRPPSQSLSAGLFLSRSGGSGLRTWAAV